MLRVLLLLSFLLANALAVHEKAGTGATEQLPGLDPNGRETAAPASDQLPGLDPNGAK